MWYSLIHLDTGQISWESSGDNKSSPQQPVVLNGWSDSNNQTAKNQRISVIKLSAITSNQSKLHPGPS